MDWCMHEVWGVVGGTCGRACAVVFLSTTMAINARILVFCCVSS